MMLCDRNLFLSAKVKLLQIYCVKWRWYFKVFSLQESVKLLSMRLLFVRLTCDTIVDAIGVIIFIRPELHVFHKLWLSSAACAKLTCLVRGLPNPCTPDNRSFKLTATHFIHWTVQAVLYDPIWLKSRSVYTGVTSIS